MSNQRNAEPYRLGTNQRYAGPIGHGTNITPNESTQLDAHIANTLFEKCTCDGVNVCSECTRQLHQRRLAVLMEIDEEPQREEGRRLANRCAVLATMCLAVLLVMFTNIASAQTVTRQATITWTAPTDCEGGAALSNCPITAYLVQKLSGTTWVELGTTPENVREYVDRNLALGTHTYRVIANSSAGAGLPSTQASKLIAVPGAPGSVVITVTVTVTP